MSWLSDRLGVHVKLSPTAAIGAVGALATGNVFGAIGAVSSGLMGKTKTSTLSLPQGVPTVPRTPVPGVKGTLERVIPGGRSGYTYDRYTQLDNVGSDKYGRPLAVYPVQAQRIQCPSGYVGVDLDGDGVKDACVLKPIARSMGKYRPRPRPPVSGYDARAIRRAERAKERVKGLAKDVGLHVYTSARPTAKKKGKK